MTRTSGRNRVLWTIAIFNLLAAWILLPGAGLGLYSTTMQRARMVMRDAHDAGAVTVDSDRLAPVLGLRPDRTPDHDDLAIGLLRPLESTSFQLVATIVGVVTLESLILILIACWTTPDLGPDLPRHTSDDTTQGAGGSAD